MHFADKFSLALKAWLRRTCLPSALCAVTTQVVFLTPVCLKKRMHQLLLDVFIQIGKLVVDTVPAGTGVIQVILQQ